MFTIGIGSTKGEVIKRRDESGNVVEFHKHKGEMVLSRLDDALLAKLSAITGGDYYRASANDREIDEIAEAIRSFDKREFAARTFERFHDRFAILAWLALLLLLLDFFCPSVPVRFAASGGR